MDYLGFVITSNFVKNPQPGNDMTFLGILSFYGNLYIHRHWEFHGFSSTLNLWGSQDYGKSLCFLLLFPYYVNLLFPYFGNCMDFCFTQNIWQTHYFGWFLFSHIFPLLWELTFLIFWELYGFLLHPKYLRNPTLWNVCFFSILFPYYGNSLSPCFGNCMDFCFIRNI